MLQPIFSFEHDIIPYMTIDDYYRELIAIAMLIKTPSYFDRTNILRKNGMPDNKVISLFTCQFNLKIQLETFEIHYGTKKRIITQDGETYKDVSFEDVNGLNFIEDLILLFNSTVDYIPIHKTISWRFRNDRYLNLNNFIENIDRKYIQRYKKSQSDLSYFIEKYEEKISFYYNTKRDISVIKQEDKIIFIESPTVKYIDEIKDVITEIQTDIKLDNDLIEFLTPK